MIWARGDRRHDASGRRGGEWRRAAAWLLVIAGLLMLMAPTVAQGREGELERAPVLLVGPEVVTAQLAADADLIGDHLDVGTAITEPAQARRAVADGDVVAALLLDLRATEDTILVRDGLHPRVRRAVIADSTAIEERYGRTLTVIEVPGRVPPDRALLRAAGLAVASGFLFALLVSLTWGPVPRTLRRGLVRITGAVALGGAVGVVALAIPALRPAADASPPWEVAGVLGLAAFAAALVSVALEALLRLHGLAAAAIVLLVLPLPLLLVGSGTMLSGPTAAMVPWTLVGAAVDAVDGVAAGHDGPVVPLIAMVGTVLVALTVLVLTRVALARAREEGEQDAADDAAIAPARWRRRIGIGAAAAVAAAALLLLLVPNDDPTPEALPSLAASTACTATGDVRGVRDLNRITRLRGSGEFQGGDVGASAGLQDGRRIWLFGDTLRSLDGGEALVHNSMLIVGDGCLQVVLPESGGPIIPDRGDVGYWPMSLTVTERPGYDLVTLFAQRTRGGDTDDVFGFTVLGPAVARFVVPVGQTPQLLSVTDIGGNDADTERPMWGAASARSGGWLYIYGTARPASADLVSGFSLRVARARVDDAARPERWQYWDGARWGERADDAAELIGAVGGTSQTLSVFRRGATWYAFSKRNEVLGTDLVFWTAPSPAGPFTAQPPSGQLATDGATGELRYMPLAHPDLFPSRGSVLVSYSRNSTDFGKVQRNPLLYRPRFLSLELPTP